MSNLMQTPELLKGNNTIPGVRVPDEILKEIPGILKTCRDWGLDFYPTIVEFLDYDGISEIAAYGGFPVRFPHWSWGEQYEELSRGYEFGYHRIYEMVVNCLESNTPTLTSRGTLPASQVKVGDHMILGNSTRNVVAVVNQPSAATKRIKLKGHLSDLICTPNHKWKVLGNEGLVWKQASDLVAGDILVGSDTYYFYQGKPAELNWTIDAVIKATRPNRVKSINPPKQMTLALAELMGSLTGDGSVGVKGNENDVYVTIGKDDFPYVEHIHNLFSAVFGSEATTQEKPTAYIALLQSKAAVDFLDKIGMVAGCTYKDKRIPHSIWSSSQEYRAAYLRGLFDTDGYVADYIGMSAYNSNLISDVQLMLMEMGIPSHVEVVSNGQRKDGTIGEITVLDVRTRVGRRKFSERIGFTIPHKVEELHQLTSLDCSSGGVLVPFLAKKVIEKGFILPSDVRDILNVPLCEVESIIDGDVIETIDIALDHDDHDFLAGGFVTHNTTPCYIYCLDSNTWVDHVTVIAHATGHNHFFKNNIFFSQTSQNMMNELANHGTRIRKYRSEWGPEEVGRFIDKVMSIETLIDPAKAWLKRKQRDPIPEVHRQYNHPRRLKIESGHEHMEDWINTKDYLDNEKNRIRDEELKKSIGLFQGADKDIFGYLKDNAPLKPWQQDVISILYEEAMYFAPQGQTKMLNEGLASRVDSQMMACYGLAKDTGIVEYAVHKAGVLGGKESMNPYKMGYSLLSDIEERWNKGQFGKEYDECEDFRQKLNWDKKLGLGHDKIFEVCKYYDDVTALSEFFTQEFCDKYEFFIWRRFPDGTYKIMERDATKIKQMLLQQYVNRGLPTIKLVEPNYKGRRIFLMEHAWDGRTLHPGQTSETMKALSFIWKGPCAVLTKDKDHKQIMYYCEDGKVDVGEPNIK